MEVSLDDSSKSRFVAKIRTAYPTGYWPLRFTYSDELDEGEEEYYAIIDMYTSSSNDEYKKKFTSYSPNENPKRRITVS